MSDEPDVREVVWRQQAAGDGSRRPASAAEARLRLERGNAAFATAGDEDRRRVFTVGPRAFGLPNVPGGDLPQEPFAAVLGCSDARVVPEVVFGQALNDLFCVRLAGHAPTASSLGSLRFAVRNLPTVRLVVVVGHTECGAMIAAVDSFLRPAGAADPAAAPELRAVLEPLLAPVTTAAQALADVHGPEVTGAGHYRPALLATAVVAHSAMTAMLLRHAVDRPIAWGVFDLATRRVGVPGASEWQPGLTEPPADDRALAVLMRSVAAGLMRRAASDAVRSEGVARP
ncbi:MAG: hypothetical protein FJ000_02895 [Actinobacteria bacterium]|nr:hypothetical protein [Actinomycetota bacterium]